MNLTRVTPPATTPVSLADAKLHLRIASGDTSQDALVGALIGAVTSHYDGWTGVLGRAMVTQTWELALDAFPSGAIQIPLGPLQSITSVKYLDLEGIERTVDSANYYVDTRSIDGWVIPLTDYVWPDSKEAANAITVRFVAGWGAASAVPEAIRQAILIRLGSLYTISSRDHAIRRESVDGVGSIDYDTSGSAVMGIERVEGDLVRPWRRVNL